MGDTDSRQRRGERGGMVEPGTETVRRRVEVANPLGLTMRTAARFVVVAKSYRAEVLVYDGTRELQGTSLVDLVTLVAPCGTPIDLEARGPDARQAVESLAGLIASPSHGPYES